MIIETVVCRLFMNKYNEYKCFEKYKGNIKLNTATNTIIILYSLLVITVFVLWIFSIINAVKCPKPNAGEIILAIFFWPLYWILKWTGVICK